MSKTIKHNLEMGKENNPLTIDDSFSRESKQSSNFTLLQQVSTAKAAGELGNGWNTLEQRIENAISVMEKAFPYMQLGTRNEVWHSLHRCYRRAESIRKLRGVESIEDLRDDAFFVDNRCMLGILI